MLMFLMIGVFSKEQFLCASLVTEMVGSKEVSWVNLRIILGDFVLLVVSQNCKDSSLLDVLTHAVLLTFCSGKSTQKHNPSAKT